MYGERTFELMLVKQCVSGPKSHGFLDIFTLCNDGRRSEQYTGMYLQFSHLYKLFVHCSLFFVLYLDRCLTLYHRCICPYRVHKWLASAARRNLNLSLRKFSSITTPTIFVIARKLNTITMATMAANDRETTQPTCQNCTTSTTPLWRRDEIGSVLCNACGLFLKLHGRPRPISLKTDVIKSRNRVKSSGSAQGAKKKVRDSLLDADLQSVQTLTRRHRVYSIRMASTRRDHKGELHLPEPSAIDEPLKNPQMATLMARIPPSPALRLPRCMAICPLSTVTPSMTHITTPHRSRNFIFANHLQAALHLP
jgi:hypothetical protein